MVRPPPWRQCQEAERQAAALKAAIAAAEAAGGAPDHVAAWQEEVLRLEKKATEKRPLAEQLEGCRSYLDRARKRRAQKQAELEAAQKSVNELDADIEAHMAKLAELELAAMPKVATDAQPTSVVDTLKNIQEVVARMQDTQEAKRRRKDQRADAEGAGDATMQGEAAGSAAAGTVVDEATALIAALQELVRKVQVAAGS